MKTLKTLPVFLLAGVFVAALQAQDIQKIKPVIDIAPGTKMRITVDNRPGSPALNKIVICKEVKKEQWLLINLEIFENDPAKVSAHVSAHSKDLPSDYVVWNWREDDPPSTGKFSILLGNPVYQLEDGEVVSSPDVRAWFLDENEKDKKEFEENLVQFDSILISKMQAVFFALEKKSSSLPPLQPPDFSKSLSGRQIVFNKWSLFGLNRPLLPDVDSFKTKIIFLNIWATWCGPCRMEMPSLQKLYDQFKDDREIFFIFLSNENDNAETINKFLEKNKLTLPVYLATNIPEGLEVSAIPTTFIVDQNSKIVFKHVGTADWNTPEAVAFLKSLKKKTGN